MQFHDSGNGGWTCPDWKLSVHLPIDGQPMITVRAEVLGASVDLRV